MRSLINSSIKFAPSSLKVNLVGSSVTFRPRQASHTSQFSAYPVLLPLYIAMYEIKRPAWHMAVPLLCGPRHTVLGMIPGQHVSIFLISQLQSTMSDNKFHDKYPFDFISKILGRITETSPDSGGLLRLPHQHCSLLP
jgi:hypothetical protein